MESLLIVIKERSFAKGLALALMDSFQSIHTTKSPFTALKIIKTEKIDFIITEISFDTIESNLYIERLTDSSQIGSTIIILNDGSFSLSKETKLLNIIIQQKPVAVKQIIKIIESLTEKFKIN
jgi:DNA-binding NtrC family response regulator